MDTYLQANLLQMESQPQRNCQRADRGWAPDRILQRVPLYLRERIAGAAKLVRTSNSAVLSAYKARLATTEMVLSHCRERIGTMLEVVYYYREAHGKLRDGCVAVRCGCRQCQLRCAGLQHQIGLRTIKVRRTAQGFP